MSGTAGATAGHNCAWPRGAAAFSAAPAPAALLTGGGQEGFVEEARRVRIGAAVEQQGQHDVGDRVGQGVGHLGRQQRGAGL